MQEQLRSDYRSFWDYARNSQGCQGIPEQIHFGNIQALGNQVSDLFASYLSPVYVNPRVVPSIQLDLITLEQFLFLSSSLSITPEEVLVVLKSLATTRGSVPMVSAFFLYRCRDTHYTKLFDF